MRCGTALYLLSVLAGHFGIVIDRAIGAPGHGKDIVDGLNATDKVYSMLGDSKMSLAVESKRLLSDPLRSSGVKAEGGKSAKREKAAKMQARQYHVQDPGAARAAVEAGRCRRAAAALRLEHGLR